MSLPAQTYIGHGKILNSTLRQTKACSACRKSIEAHQPPNADHCPSCQHIEAIARVARGEWVRTFRLQRDCAECGERKPGRPIFLRVKDRKVFCEACKGGK